MASPTAGKSPEEVAAWKAAISRGRAARAKADMEWKDENPASHKLCSVCRKAKPIAHFGGKWKPTKTMGDRWVPASLCRECDAVKQKARGERLRAELGEEEYRRRKNEAARKSYRGRVEARGREARRRRSGAASRKLLDPWPLVYWLSGVVRWRFDEKEGWMVEWGMDVSGLPSQLSKACRAGGVEVAVVDRVLLAWGGPDSWDEVYPGVVVGD